MVLKKSILVAALCLPVLMVSAQTKAPENWFTLDATKDKVQGTGADEALHGVMLAAQRLVREDPAPFHPMALHLQPVTTA